MSDKKEDKSMSAHPKPINPYEMSPEAIEKLLKMARPVKHNEKGTILLDKSDPLDREWYGDEDEGAKE
jgi:hypothetical protein